MPSMLDQLRYTVNLPGVGEPFVPPEPPGILERARGFLGETFSPSEEELQKPRSRAVDALLGLVGGGALAGAMSIPALAPLAMILLGTARRRQEQREGLLSEMRGEAIREREAERAHPRALEIARLGPEAARFGAEQARAGGLEQQQEATRGVIEAARLGAEATKAARGTQEASIRAENYRKALDILKTNIDPFTGMQVDPAAKAAAIATVMEYHGIGSRIKDVMSLPPETQAQLFTDVAKAPETKRSRLIQAILDEIHGAGGAFGVIQRGGP